MPPAKRTGPCPFAHPPRPPSPPTLLAAALAAAFASTAFAEDAPLRADGENRRFASGTYETHDDDSSALVVLRGGRGAGREIRLGTFGNRSHAASVSGTASTLTLSGGGLHTRGNGAWGIEVLGSGMEGGTGDAAATLRDLSILTEGTNAAGAYIHKQGSRGAFERVTIDTLGRVASGIVAEEHGAVSFEESTIRTQGDEAAGIRLQDAAESLKMRDGTIETAGRGSAGVILGSGSAGLVSQSHITTAGDNAAAFSAGIGSGQLAIDRSELRTHGMDSAGFSAQNGGFASINDSRIETSGVRGVGIDNRASDLTVKATDIVTTGRSAYGILSKGGEYAGRIPHVEAYQAHVSTQGRFAHGVHATAGGQVTLEESSVDTSGESAHGLQVDAGDIVAVTTRIAATGKDAYGAIVAHGGSLIVDGGSLESTQSAAIGTADPGAIQITGGARVAGGNGRFLEVDRASTHAFRLTLEGKSDASGDIAWLPAPADVLPAPAARPSLSLDDHASWQGATTMVDRISIQDGSTWTITGDSQVGSLHNDNGIVAFAPRVAGTFATLSVEGDYTGTDGLLRMRAPLGDDVSPSDRLHVHGNTSGRTFVAIDTLDGKGDYTHDGVRLVRVDGASNAEFRLSGRAVAGAHEYFLRKGDLAGNATGDWYLRSSLPPEPVIDPIVEPVVKPKPDDPEPPIEPVVPEPSPRVIRPEVGTYRANQLAALDMFRGGPAGNEDDEPSTAHRSAWARFERQHTAFNVADQLVATSSASVLTVGADILHTDGSGDGTLGVMLAAGQADTRGTSSLTGYTAKGRTRGTALGMYGGFHTDNGSFMRGWWQHAHVDQRVDGTALPSQRYSTGLMTASVEVGRRWRRTITRQTVAWLEPQAQIVATRLRGGTLTETQGGTVIEPLHASGVDARIGLRAAARWHTPGGHVASPYLAASWVRRLGRLDATTFNGEPFTDGVPRNSYALKLGTTFVRRSGWRAWTDVETRFGARRYRRVTGTIGIRRAW